MIRKGKSAGHLFAVLSCLLLSKPALAQDGPSIMHKDTDMVRIAILHMDSRPADMTHNRQVIEKAIQLAASANVDWLVTPELAETGYTFFDQIGLDWVEPFPSQWVQSLSKIARHNSMALFIGMPERDAVTNDLHNSVAVIDSNGSILGTHRKFQVVQGGSESWAVPEEGNRPFVVNGISVGVLICADVAFPELAGRLAQDGASIFLSPTNWPPVGDMGPSGQWEDRTRENGLPMLVANRTGQEATLDFREGISAVVVNGARQETFAFPSSHLILLDWDRADVFTTVGTIDISQEAVAAQ